jgi:CrcB protein
LPRVEVRLDNPYLAISIGAVLGANVRYWLGGFIGDRMGSAFPWSTLIINVSGSLIIGVVLGLAADRVMPSWWRPGFAIGFLGSYTTFSTFSYETLNLIQQRSYLAAVANIGGSVVIGLVAVLVGVAIAKVI